MDISLPEQPGYEKLRHALARRLQRLGGSTVSDGLFLLPDLLVALGRVLLDPSTPAGRRFVSTHGIGYLVVPAGGSRLRTLRLLDQPMLVLLAVREMLISTDAATLQRYWAGNDIRWLYIFLSLLEKAQERIPKRVHRHWQAVRPF